MTSKPDEIKGAFFGSAETEMKQSGRATLLTKTKLFHH
jgi:hypothetical protein